MDEFGEIQDERLRLVDRLRSVRARDFDQPSLCEGWTVRQVLAHLVTPFLVSRASMASAVVRRGGISAAMDAKAREIAERPPAQLVGILEQHAASRFRPPGMPVAAPLTDVIAHSADIRWVLDDERADWATEQRMRPVLDFLVGRRSRIGFVPAGRVRGLRLIVDELQWEHGRGAEVRGAALAMTMAILGRRPALCLLTGYGVPALSER